jgi:hypothetical protein
MERNLLKRELEALEISPKSSWLRPTDAFNITQTDGLVKLFDTSLIFGDDFQNAVNNNFSIKGRFSILAPKDYARKGGPSESLGFTDKKKGQAFLTELDSRGASSIEAALHEGIHLISFPLKGADASDLAFAKKFSFPLMEAVTQYFTRIMMIEAGLKNWKTESHQKNIDKHLKPFFKVFSLLQIDIMKRLEILREMVFKNNVTFFRSSIEQQLLVVNKSLTKPEANDWANRIDLIFSFAPLKEVINFVESIIQKDYNKARKIFSDAFSKKHKP